VGKWEAPELLECYDRVIAACNRHGVAPGIHLKDTASLGRWVGRGMRLATYSTDAGLLIEAGSKALGELRALVPKG